MAEHWVLLSSLYCPLLAFLVCPDSDGHQCHWHYCPRHEQCHPSTATKTVVPLVSWLLTKANIIAKKGLLFKAFGISFIANIVSKVL